MSNPVPEKIQALSSQYKGPDQTLAFLGDDSSCEAWLLEPEDYPAIFGSESGDTRFAAKAKGWSLEPQSTTGAVAA